MRYPLLHYVPTLMMSSNQRSVLVILSLISESLIQSLNINHNVPPYHDQNIVPYDFNLSRDQADAAAIVDPENSSRVFILGIQMISSDLFVFMNR